jgi:dUTP pyrophosphatase
MRTLNNIKYSSEFGFPLVKGSKDASAYDLCAGTSGQVLPGETVLVNTGIRLELPPGMDALVCCRSGLALKNSIHVLNSPGIVDEDFKGSIGIILHNSHPVKTFQYEAGMRLAQLRFAEVPWTQLEAVDKIEVNTERGEGGFGSTGTDLK